MLRNPLIVYLTERGDNDNVAVDINGVSVNVVGVIGRGGHIVLVCDPGELQNAADQGAHEHREGPAAMSSHSDYLVADAMAASQVQEQLREHPDADVVIDFGGTRIDVYQTTYDPKREQVVLHPHADDVADVARNHPNRPPTIGQDDNRRPQGRETNENCVG